jgi:hypothetical protein
MAQRYASYTRPRRANAHCWPGTPEAVPTPTSNRAVTLSFSEVVCTTALEFSGLCNVSPTGELRADGSKLLTNPDK